MTQLIDQVVAPACNDYLRENECRFPGDRPGYVIIEWANVASRDQRIPSVCDLAMLLESARIRVEYSATSNRALTILWQLLRSEMESLEAIQIAVGAMRVFRKLVDSPVRDAYWHATRFIDRHVATILSSRRSCNPPSEVLEGASPNPRSEAASSSLAAATNDIQRVFASYCRRDAPIVSPIIRLARVPGVTIFLDTDSLEPGDNWSAKIASAIKESDVMMVFWSRHAAESIAVRDEYERALALEKRVVPVLLDSTPLDQRLSKYQWVDLRSIAVAAVLQRESEVHAPGRQELLTEQMDAISIGNATTWLLAHLSRMTDPVSD